ncbi:putative protein isoform X2 [Capsicum annuum]|nr:uncharacterized protein LOC107864553 isoform X2 [Capsicum annuum]
MATEGSLEVPSEEFPTRINYRPNGKPRIVIEHYMPELEAYVPREAEPIDLNVMREINDRLTAMLEDVRLMKKRLTRIMILQLLCLVVAFSGLFVKLIRKYFLWLVCLINMCCCK